jgi:hypothetical protein
MPSQSRQKTSLELSLITAPFLLALVALDSMSEGLIELGKASEEVFRGERLPVLKFPAEGANLTQKSP